MSVSCFPIKLLQIFKKFFQIVINIQKIFYCIIGKSLCVDGPMWFKPVWFRVNCMIYTVYTHILYSICDELKIT